MLPEKKKKKVDVKAFWQAVKTLMEQHLWEGPYKKFQTNVTPATVIKV